MLKWLREFFADKQHPIFINVLENRKIAYILYSNFGYLISKPQKDACLHFIQMHKDSPINSQYLAVRSREALPSNWCPNTTPSPSWEDVVVWSVIFYTPRTMLKSVMTFDFLHIKYLGFILPVFSSLTSSCGTVNDSWHTLVQFL